MVKTFRKQEAHAVFPIDPNGSNNNSIIAEPPTWFAKISVCRSKNDESILSISMLIGMWAINIYAWRIR